MHAGGALGGFVNAITEPIFEFFRIAGTNGWATHMHDPDASDAVLYASHRVIWGSIWGLLFLLPLHKSVKNFWLRSVIFGKLHLPPPNMPQICGNTCVLRVPLALTYRLGTCMPCMHVQSPMSACPG